MPKVQLQSSDIGQVSTIAAGTYSNIRSIIINASNIIDAINTYTPSGSGLVSSVNGTIGQISVAPTVGIPQVDLVSSITPVSNATISSITTDSYGRISAITTASIVSSGTFSSLKSITVNGRGQLTGIDTSTVIKIIPNNSVMTGTAFTSSTSIISSREYMYVYTTPQSGIINIDISTASNFYFVPSGNFSFNFINGPDLTTTGFNIEGLTYATPIVSISIIVNNTGGYSWYYSSVISYSGADTWRYNGADVTYPGWAGGFRPVGTAGRIEIYNFLFLNFYGNNGFSRPLSWASMSTNG
jgi:hypothetical protein